MKKKKWTYDYDKDNDNLFVGEYPMVRTAKLIKINSDISIYADKKGDIRGIFIEYFEHDLKKRLKRIANL